MDLSGLLSVIEEAPSLRELRKRLATDGTVRLTLGLGEGKPAALAGLVDGVGAPMLVVAAHPNQAEALADDMASWLRRPEQVIIFPEHSLPPYEHMTTDPETVADRLHALTRLLDHPEVIVVTSVKAL
ncbi:MAG TPA: hypothetical protein VFB90_04555, partial [Dehalococcoidia bacterium]|nr:hypothetical protein [Dehalococcoidia bacterium]